ncbi:MAG: GTPase HflX [Acidiferrobacterales bacterium]|nr:GTPase HflX [Acidiferrobacterales bacterium]
MAKFQLGTERPESQNDEEFAVIVRQDSSPISVALDNLEEIQLLAEAAGAQVVGTVVSRRARPHSGLFVGKGKVDELHSLVASTSATIVIVDHAITPVQERNLENALQCRVIDRTRLILDIFARRASSREGKLQVELAQLKHLSTRLVRGWTHLERQKGGIGLRGPGETQLETDRRLIGRRIKTLTQRLEKIRTQRELRRKSRKKVPIATVALVGYTNAGKSSLFNRLCGASVVSRDMLFSTLDTTMRRLELPGFGPVILSDTVGFIRELPHGLISAFHATLEEVSSASILLHVVDASCNDADDRIENVEAVLSQIGADEVPRVLVYNKVDLTDHQIGRRKSVNDELGRVWLSSLTGQGIDALMGILVDHFCAKRLFGRIRIPVTAGKLRSYVYQHMEVLNESYGETGECVLDLEVSVSDADWLESNQEFKDEYWQVRPELHAKALQ